MLVILLPFGVSRSLWIGFCLSFGALFQWRALLDRRLLRQYRPIESVMCSLDPPRKVLSPESTVVASEQSRGQERSTLGTLLSPCIPL